MQMACQKGCIQCAHPHRGMTAQDSQRLRGATGNVGLEPEDLGLNFTIKTSLSISSFVHHLEPQSPTSLAPRTSFMEDNFSSDQGWGGDGFRMLQVHYFYPALYFYDYYISSTSDHQALDSGGWGPLLWRCLCTSASRRVPGILAKIQNLLTE